MKPNTETINKNQFIILRANKALTENLTLLSTATGISKSRLLRDAIGNMYRNYLAKQP